MFILGMSAAGIITWRLNESLLEDAHDRERQARRGAGARAASAAGSSTSRPSAPTWSREMYRLYDVPATTSTPTLENVPRSCPPRRPSTPSTRDIDARARRTACPSRWTTASCSPTATIRWLHGRGEVTGWADGRPVAHGGHRAGRHRAPPVRGRAAHERADLRDTLSLLSATLDATADGILVVDLDGRITSFNRRFVEMWQIPDEVLDVARRRGRARRTCSTSSPTPTASSPRSRELYAQPEAESHDTIEFKDGRVVERYSKPAAGRRRDRRPGVELPRRHRAQAARGRARPPGVPRLAHRPRQPGAVPRPRRATPWPRTAARGGDVWRCCSSTSTTSRPSTTASATPPATSCSSPSTERLRGCLRAGGHRGPARRRRVRRAARGHRRRATRPIDRRRADPRGAPRSRSTSAGKEVVRRRQHRHRRSATPAIEQRPAAAQRRPRHVHAPRAAARAATRCSRPRCTTAAVERLELEADLRRAVERRRAAAPLPADRRPRRPARSSASRRSLRWQHPDARAAGARRRSSRSPRRRGLIDELGALGARRGVPRRSARWHDAHPDRRRLQRQRQPLAPPAPRRRPRRRRAPTRSTRPGCAAACLDPRDHRGGDDARHRGRARAPRPRSRRSACSSPSTTSAPATRRSATSSASRSTC